MKINPDHRLYHDNDDPFPYVESPNSYPKNAPQYLIMHYTANATAGPAIKTLTDPRPDNPDARVSAHLVIAPDGTITQLLPFDKGGWHAGESNWEGKHWLNHFSIGIEIVNDGKLKPGPDQQTWRSAGGTIYEERDVYLAMHWKEFREVGWARYPKAQLDAVYRVARTLVAHYGLKDILGHEDIHEGKVDPGPAFPIEAIRQDIYGRKNPCLKTYKMKTTTKVYLKNPGKIRMPPEVGSSPLPPKTKVAVKKVAGEWAEIKGKGKVFRNVSGWVNLERLRGSEKKIRETIQKTPVYRMKPDPGPPLHKVKSLKAGVRIRVLREEGLFALVAILEPVPDYKFMQGWVHQSSFVLIDGNEGCNSKMIDPDTRLVGGSPENLDQPKTEQETQPPMDQLKTEEESQAALDQPKTGEESQAALDQPKTEEESQLSPVRLIIHVEWK